MATFCTTYDDDDVRYLMDMSVNKNLIDKDEYPQSAEIETRCVSMLAALWNAPRATLYDLSDRLRIRGWQVPAYPLPANRQDTTVQRILIRHGFSRELARLLVTDIERSAAALIHGSRASQPGFHHT